MLFQFHPALSLVIAAILPWVTGLIMTILLWHRIDQLLTKTALPILGWVNSLLKTKFTGADLVAWLIGVFMGYEYSIRIASHPSLISLPNFPGSLILLVYWAVGFNLVYLWFSYKRRWSK